jgi:hypothetical protein
VVSQYVVVYVGNVIGSASARSERRWALGEDIAAAGDVRVARAHGLGPVLDANEGSWAVHIQANPSLLMEDPAVIAFAPYARTLWGQEGPPGGWRAWRRTIPVPWVRVRKAA